MFFQMFLLTILANVSTTVIAEKDYYKYYDEYDDYDYGDATIEKADNTPTDGTTYTSITTPNKESGELHDKTTKTVKQLKQFIIKEPTHNKSATGDATNNDDELTFVLTDKPKDSKVGYEVTEIVDDIPNTVTFKPIVSNFTIKLPLNNATGATNSIDNKNEDNKKSSTRKNTINIFHLNAEFDDEKDNKPTIQNINIHKIPFGIFKVKDTADKVKDDVFNYIHSTEILDEPYEGHFFPNILSAPRHILRKIREKGSAIYHKLFY